MFWPNWVMSPRMVGSVAAFTQSRFFVKESTLGFAPRATKAPAG
jgi:hypothetical protein